MKIKLCGFKEESSLKAAIKADIDFIGFVFHDSSPRNVTFDQAKHLCNIVPDNINKVSVTVDASIDKLQEIHNALKPQYFQLHGNETLSDIETIKEIFPAVKIIKAFSICTKQDLEQVKPYESHVTHILLDNKNPGSGQSFDWNLLDDFKTKSNWILSGGLNLTNIVDAIHRTDAKIVDISSGIEVLKGDKSPELIEQITTIINNIK